MNFRRTTRHGCAKSCCTSFAILRSLMAALLLPFVMLLLFGYALSLDVDHIPTIVYDRRPQRRRAEN